jgi:hypothetical protein
LRPARSAGAAMPDDFFATMAMGYFSHHFITYLTGKP